MGARSSISSAPDWWDLREDAHRERDRAKTPCRSTTVQKQIADIDRQIEGLVTRLVDPTNASVIAAYEKRIGELEAQKVSA